MAIGFICGSHVYTHAKCPDCGTVKKLDASKDWTEQDVCLKCCCPWNMYDPKRKKTAMDEPNEEHSVEEQLENLCIRIAAHADMDGEIDISGNGVNACEALAVAWGILDILHGDGRKWLDAKPQMKRINAEVKKLRKAMGDED